MMNITNENDSNRKQLRYYSTFTYTMLCILIPVGAVVVVDILLQFLSSESGGVGNDIALLPVSVVWWVINTMLYVSSLCIYVAAKKGKITESKQRQLFNVGIVSLVAVALTMVVLSVFRIMA